MKSKLDTSDQKTSRKKQIKKEKVRTDTRQSLSHIFPPPRPLRAQRSQLPQDSPKTPTARLTQKGRRGDDACPLGHHDRDAGVEEGHREVEHLLPLRVDLDGRHNHICLPVDDGPRQTRPLPVLYSDTTPAPQQRHSAVRG